MRVEQELKGMGLELGPVGSPVANYVPTVQTGNLLYVAGHIAGKPDGSVLNPGQVGREVPEWQAYESAKLAMRNSLSSTQQVPVDLDRVKLAGLRRVCVYSDPALVRPLALGDPEFDRHFVVGNGAADLLVELYGDQGRHARSAVGMSGLPRKSCVEIEMIVEVGD